MTPETRRDARIAVAHETHRLVMASVAYTLDVSYSELARDVGTSRSALYNLATLGFWPKRTDPETLKHKLRGAFKARGASAEQLLALFEPCQTSVGRNTPMPDPRARTAAGGEPIFEEDMLLPKQALTPQARRHFRLFVNPFDGEVVSDDMMFSGDDFAYVREASWQCSQTGGFVAVCGESGAGKTTVLVDLEARLQQEARGVIIFKPSVLGMEESDRTGKTLKSTDILHAIITQLDGQHAVPQTLQARTVRARKLLANSVQAGNTHLLVVDEAHSMPDAALRHLKRLHELREGRRPLLGILLLGQPELKLRLARGLSTGALREVAQRCEVVELLPLDSDLKAYLQRRAAASKVELDALIDDGAIEQLRDRLTRRVGKDKVSMCYPLAVNNLVTRAMNEAARLGAPKVTRDVVQAV